jgi:hypothetical protein
LKDEYVSKLSVLAVCEKLDAIAKRAQGDEGAGTGLITATVQTTTATIRRCVLASDGADVQEIVRCKDCLWCHSGYCERFDDLIPFGCSNMEWEDWYCADGKRKAVENG